MVDSSLPDLPKFHTGSAHTALPCGLFGRSFGGLPANSLETHKPVREALFRLLDWANLPILKLFHTRRSLPPIVPVDGLSLLSDRHNTIPLAFQGW